MKGSDVLTCEATGCWMPNELPACIREDLYGKIEEKGGFRNVQPRKKPGTSMSKMVPFLWGFRTAKLRYPGCCPLYMRARHDSAFSWALRVRSLRPSREFLFMAKHQYTQTCHVMALKKVSSPEVKYYAV